MTRRVPGRTLRNACAHISKTTRIPLENLALKLTGQPMPGVSVYRLLTLAISSGTTAFELYKAKLLVAAELIAQG